VIPMFAKKQPETTAGVLSEFRATITRLQGVQDAHSALADEKLAEAKRLEGEALAAKTEALEASAAIGKLQAVFG